MKQVDINSDNCTPQQSNNPGDAFDNLCQIMERLRSKNGCPWDGEQTPESLKPYILEEAYEVLDAIDSKNIDKICEELGDLLLQVVFQAQIFKENGAFTAADVAQGISRKLLRRHPHVFDEATVTDQDDLHRQWDRIKQQEKRNNGEAGSVLDSIPEAMPSLMKAQKLASRAARHGLCQDLTSTSKSRLQETMQTLDGGVEPNSKEQIHTAIGDLLFSISDLARQFDCNAELALNDATKRFRLQVKMSQTPTDND